MMQESDPVKSKSPKARKPAGPIQLKSFDLYTKIDDAYKVKTPWGATVSVIGWIFIAILVMGELSSYLSPVTKEHMVVDTSLGNRLQINVNISFHALTCSQVHLDTMDIAGDNQINIEHDMRKQRLSALGAPIGDPTTAVMKVKNADAEDPDKCLTCYGAESPSRKCCNTCDELRKAYEEKGWSVTSVLKTATQCLQDPSNPLLSLESPGEGCRISGKMTVNKVSGNFHIAHGESIVRDGRHIHQFNPVEAPTFNVSHTIHSISFGEPYPNMPVNPLDKRVRMVSPDTGTGLFQYFIKIIPTIYREGGVQLVTNQYTVTERFRPFALPDSGQGAILPGIFFVYDLSPFMIEVSKASVPLSHLITRLLAIIGGTFTVLGVVDSMAFKLQSMVSKTA